jgi:hypothetical protein
MNYVCVCVWIDVCTYKRVNEERRDTAWMEWGEVGKEKCYLYPAEYIYIYIYTCGISIMQLLAGVC